VSTSHERKRARKERKKIDANMKTFKCGKTPHHDFLAGNKLTINFRTADGRGELVDVEPETLVDTGIVPRNEPAAPRTDPEFPLSFSECQT